MKWTLKYTKQALKFLKNTPEKSVEAIDPSIRKAIKKVISREQTNINIQKLIYCIGWRGDVYK